MTKAQQYIIAILCADAGLPAPIFEYSFAKPRRWRADAVWRDDKLILEVEGGYAIQGRHVRVGGFLADMEKYNAAAVLGYRLLRVAPKHITSGEAMRWITQALSTTTTTEGITP